MAREKRVAAQLRVIFAALHRKRYIRGIRVGPGGRDHRRVDPPLVRADPKESPGAGQGQCLPGSAVCGAHRDFNGRRLLAKTETHQLTGQLCGRFPRRRRRRRWLVNQRWIAEGNQYRVPIAASNFDFGKSLGSPSASVRRMRRTRPNGLTTRRARTCSPAASVASPAFSHLQPS